MTSRCIRLAGQVLGASLVTGFIWSATAMSASAQDVSSDQIIKALTPPPITRSLTAPDQPSLSDSDRAFIESLRHRTRSLTVDEADHAEQLASKTPTKIDIDIYFDFNSAEVSPKAVPELNQLANALHSAQLENSVIMLGGHTDAKGSEPYNQDLSQRRAEAVKKYLVEKLKVSPDNLSTAGYGKRDLKNTKDPYAAENRRVQIVNFSPLNQAQR